MKIKLNVDFKKCDLCRGSGKVIVDDGHDCWGRGEWHYSACPKCHGDTFLLSSDLINKIKEKVK